MFTTMLVAPIRFTPFIENGWRGYRLVPTRISTL